jgi:DNA-binding response OmpR family regulator
VKILVVEDNEQLGEMLVERLERRGHVVILATDRATGFSSAKASQPDVILLEAQLRGDEDWAAARALKFDDHTRDIPIIALMASNSEEARAAALKNGCDELHGKPVDFNHLIQQIDSVADGEPADGEAPAEP